MPSRLNSRLTEEMQDPNTTETTEQTLLNAIFGRAENADCPIIYAVVTENANYTLAVYVTEGAALTHAAFYNAKYKGDLAHCKRMRLLNIPE